MGAVTLRHGQAVISTGYPGDGKGGEDHHRADRVARIGLPASVDTEHWGKMELLFVSRWSQDWIK